MPAGGKKIRGAIRTTETRKKMSDTVVGTEEQRKCS